MDKKGVKATSSNFGGMGWLLIIYIAATFFICGLGGSVQNITAGVFEGMYGWNQAFVISLNSIGGWIGVLFIFLFGILMTKGKMNLRVTILYSAVIVGVCYIFMGRTSSLALYSVMFCVYVVFYQIWAQLANSALCNNWFPRKKGVAIGWATMGFPLAPSIGLVIFSKILFAKGFPDTHTAYLVIGVAGIVVGVLAFLIFRNYPEEQGRFPDNDPNMTREQADAELAEGQALIANSPWTIKRLLTTKEVWLAFVAAGLIGFFGGGSISQVVPRLMGAGFTSDQATGMIAACALIALPGSYLIGFLDGKFGTKKAYIIAMIMCIVGGLLYAIPNPATIWPGLVIIGVALGGSSNFPMSFTTTYFGRYHFQKAFGVTLTINQLVMNAGAIVIAYLAAAKGWTVSYVVVSVLCLLGIILILPVKDNFTAKYEAQFAKEDGNA